MTAKRSDNTTSFGVDALSSPADQKLTDKQAYEPEGHDAQQITPLEQTRGERVLEMLARAKAEILASGHFSTPNGLAQSLNMDASALKVWMRKAEEQLQIFSVEHEGHRLYPSYAFMTDGSLIRGLQNVLTILHPERDSWGMAFWFQSPTPFSAGSAPKTSLARISKAFYSQLRKRPADSCRDNS